MGSFQVVYNAGGTLDEVKKLKIIELINQIENIGNIENIESVDVVDEILNVTSVDTVDEVLNVTSVDTVDEVLNVTSVDIVDEVSIVDEVLNVTSVDTVDLVSEVSSVDTVSNVTTVDTVNKIKGFASHVQPFNRMWKYNIPALRKDPVTGGDFEFNIELLPQEMDILAITLTCSGYGEDDHYDLFVNDVQWFDNWYCSEVKEGLFLGTSTYVYAAAANSNIKLVFKNDSGTSKTIWFGIRMLVN